MKTKAYQQLRKKWLFLAVSGLILNGAGLSLMGEALILKSQGQSLANWFWLGTLALVCINAGISLVGAAAVVRVKMEAQS
jgi:hypothetical protein